jgi:hypothetical protein
MSNSTLSLKGRTSTGSIMYDVTKSKSNNDSLSKSYQENDNASKAKSRASKLGVKVLRGQKNHRQYKGQGEFKNEDSIAQASGNIAISGNENINVITDDNEYFGNGEVVESNGNFIDDSVAIQKANKLTVSQQNPFVHEDNDVHVSESNEKPRKKGVGFLGRNARKSRYK